MDKETVGQTGTQVQYNGMAKPSRFDYVKYDAEAITHQDGFKGVCSDLEREIEAYVKCPRSKALALTKLEEVYMWIGKGIRNDQIARNGSAELQEGRTNS